MNEKTCSPAVSLLFPFVLCFTLVGLVSCDQSLVTRPPIVGASSGNCVYHEQ